MRQVKQTLGWGGVFRAFFTLMVVPNFANGLPLNPSNSKTFSKSTQTTGRRNDGDVSVVGTLGKNFTVHDETVLRGLEKSLANRDVMEGNFSKGIKSRTRSLGKEESPVTHGLRSQSPKRPTNDLMWRQRRTLFSIIKTGSNSPSQAQALMTRRTTANETFLPQRRRRRAALGSRRRMEDEHISANILNNSITTYQGLNVSSPLSLTINESNDSGEVNSSSQSLWSSSWSSSSNLEDDVHVNRTNDVPNTHDNPRFHKNRLRGFNISNLLRIRKCHENLTDSAQGGNDTLIRSRRRRGLESEGCQVLHVFHGYIMVDPSGLVTTTWDGDDIYTRLYIFSIGPGYSRIKGIAADRYIHMDDAGSVRGIPSSQIPEPYNVSNSLGAWYEAPGLCQGSTWIQWYRKGGARKELKWYLAFNRQGRVMRTQRTHANMCNASFMKTMSTGTSCNPNDGGYTNN